MTLHFRHVDLPLGDIVLLWNAENPERMAVDLGTGLERLAWARTRMDWCERVYANSAKGSAGTDLGRRPNRRSSPRLRDRPGL